MQGHQAFLDVGAGAHLLRAADQHAHRTVADFLEEGLFLGVGFGVADGGDLLARECRERLVSDDVLVGRIAPRGRIDAHVGRKSSACRVSRRSSSRWPRHSRPARLTFDSGKSGAVAESILASVASLRPSVVMASALSTRGSTFCDRSRS